MTNKQEKTIQQFCQISQPPYWKLEHYGPIWALVRCRAPLELIRGEYENCIELMGLKAVIIESGELCLAFRGGYMLWVYNDRIYFGCDPTNPLQR